MLNQVTTIITTDKAVANNETRLSICLRSNGFSFSLTTVDDLLLTFGLAQFDLSRSFSEMAQSLKEFFSQNNIPTFGLKQVRLIVPTEHCVWIPNHLYDSVRDRQYLRMIANPNPGLGVYHIAVPHLKSYIVYTAPTTVVTAFKLAIPGIDVHCQHSVLTNPELIQNSLQHPIVLMHVRENIGDFEVVYNGQLLLSNSFNYSSEDELIYHAIDIMKQLHVETPDMHLCICGIVGREIFGKLQHYFPNVSLYTGRSISFLNPEFQTLPTYQHAMLLS